MNIFSFPTLFSMILLNFTSLLTPLISFPPVLNCFKTYSSLVQRQISPCSHALRQVFLLFLFPTLLLYIASHFSTHSFNNFLLLNFYTHSPTPNDSFKQGFSHLGRHEPALPGRYDKAGPLFPTPEIFIQQSSVGLNNMHFSQVFK